MEARDVTLEVIAWCVSPALMLVGAVVFYAVSWLRKRRFR